MANRLKNEKSPYLLQHKDNLVEWYPWCGEAFQKAKEEDKPVFLSIGYSTCHWCHVMAHESFEDAEAAKLLNRGYVCIKVDREERPDIDAVYMSVCQAVTGAGGWPLTIIMTPEQKPFFAGTYFPKENYYGRPGLMDILRKVLVLWKERREDLLRDAEEITAAINQKDSIEEDSIEEDSIEEDSIEEDSIEEDSIEENHAGRPHSGKNGTGKCSSGKSVKEKERSGKGRAGRDRTGRWRSEEDFSEKTILRQAYHLFAEAFDPVWGGFGSAPKFPSPHNLLFLMRYAKEEKEGEALCMAEATLQAMADGGIHDHIGGGFSRYSTDAKWLVPHFEKMLYDNALLILAYLEAYQMTGREKYADVVRHTADYILRELTDEQGGFYCGQDADSDGVEGKYYVFTPKEAAAVLGEQEGREFCRRYGITEEGNFEGKSIPNRIGHAESEEESIKHQGIRAEDHVESLDAGTDMVVQEESVETGELLWKKKLYEYRLSRTRLHKDDKILLSWNAWTILALARAGVALEEARYLEAAGRAQHFIETHMTNGDNRLWLRFRDKEAAQMGQLEDYAVYALALLELYKTGFQTEYLSGAVLRAEQMVRFFEDTRMGGYYINASDAAQLIARPKEMYDGAVPSGNSVAAMALQKLAILTGDVRWQEAARRQSEYCVRKIREYPAGYSFALLALAEGIYPHRELVCTVCGELPSEQKRRLMRLAAEGMNILVKTEENACELAECAPFTAEYPLPQEGELYYLCEDGACKAPVTELC